MANKKKKKWMRPRHRLVRNVLNATLGIYTRIKYGIKVKRFKEQQKRPYLVLYNHQTTFDQFFIGMAFKGSVYYLASEDLFSNGWVSSLIRYLVAPIPIKKHTTDVRAILNCIQVAREGGTIAIAPEGNRTYSGKTEHMSATIAPLARKLGLPIALFRIEGGYGVNPRWSNDIRKGKMQAYVSEVISPEEYAAMTDDELFARIKDGLYVNEAQVTGEFLTKHGAEYLERAIYVCPECGFSHFESSGDVFVCKGCGKASRYTKTKELVGDFPFRFVGEWYDYQSDFVNSYDPMAHTDAPIYTDTASLFESIPYKKKMLISEEATLSLFGDRVVVTYGEDRLEMPFADLSGAAVLGRNKLNLLYNGKTYQFKGTRSFCALKYVQLYHRYDNVRKGDNNGKFLGL